VQADDAERQDPPYPSKKCPQGVAIGSFLYVQVTVCCGIIDTALFISRLISRIARLILNISNA
jgi:hypothetical protein